MVWKYETIIKFLKYMKKDLDFKVPYDTYLQQFYRSEGNQILGGYNQNWYTKTTFYGVSKSNVQGDVKKS